MNASYTDGERTIDEGGRYSGQLPTCSSIFYPSVRFYLSVVCVTLVNILITLLLLVRDHSESRFTRPFVRVHPLDRLPQVQVRASRTVSCETSTPSVSTSSTQHQDRTPLKSRLQAHGRLSEHKPETFEHSGLPKSAIKFDVGFWAKTRLWIWKLARDLRGLGLDIWCSCSRLTGISRVSTSLP